MKRFFIYSLCAIMIAGSSLTSCMVTNPYDYYGTVVGGEIGGAVGQGIGMVTTHGSFAGSLFGSVVGTVAGSAIGNNISRRSREQRQQQRRQRREYYDNQNQNNYDNTVGEDYEIPDFQTEGGASDLSNARNFAIRNVIVTDPNENGVLDKEETMEVVCEITNLSDTDSDIVISIGSSDDKYLEYSPAINTSIGGDKSVRYTAKILCKKVPSSDEIDIPITVTSATLGTVTRNVHIKFK